jgi:hypothetical protein
MVFASICLYTFRTNQISSPYGPHAAITRIPLQGPSVLSAFDPLPPFLQSVSRRTPYCWFQFHVRANGDINGSGRCRALMIDDNGSRLSQIGYASGSTSLGNVTYLYDALGRRTSIPPSARNVFRVHPGILFALPRNQARPRQGCANIAREFSGQTQNRNFLFWWH